MFRGIARSTSMRDISLRGLLSSSLLGACILHSPLAVAQSFPSRAVTLVVPFSPGTGIDLLARTLGPKLADRWNVPVVVDNKSGASGNIGSEQVMHATPDGHNLLVTATSFATNVAINSAAGGLRYDPVKSFAPIAVLATGTLTVVVASKVPANSLAEFIALAKRQPGALHYASSGNGTPQHLAMELFKLEAGLNMIHVPYKGNAGAYADLVGGHVDAMVSPIHTAAPYVAGGKLRMLGVLGAERTPLFPNVPTLKESGFPKLDMEVWYAMFAPRATPADTVNRINTDVNVLLSSNEIREALVKQGLVAAGGRPQRLADLVALELARWPQVVAKAGIRAD